MKGRSAVLVAVSELGHSFVDEFLPVEHFGRLET
jgi:hypothetical protein